MKLTAMHFLSGDHAVFVLAAFLATLGCFTALAILGGDGRETLADVLIAMGGALAGISIAKRGPFAQPPPEPEPEPEK